jgi:crotonobetainyl-CoA:carnitine CoA-transferase CaiB-like acyl-CoA transferase
VDTELERLWALVPGPGDLPEHRATGPTVAPPSAFEVGRAATVSVAAATLGALSLGVARGLDAEPPVISADHAVTACSGPVRVDGEVIPAWAALSGRYPTADQRFVQIHANFPHHAAGVAKRLGVPEEREAVAAAIEQWPAIELESALVEAGMICAAYRSLEEWADHPHDRATRHLPPIEITRIGDADPVATGPARDRPLDGIRVLDCSRVLAGPACGQTLAAGGADVLRVGAAHLPSVPAGVVATGFGKRNAFVDLRTGEGVATFRRLLAGADVFVDAYRPGALAARGFAASDAALLRPGIVVVEISAFDWEGPWAGRRGFDSIVQSSTGLAVAGGQQSGSDVPVHLPFQALDYATGFLAAFAASRLLAHRRVAGGSWRARLSLLRTRNWLVGLGAPRAFTPGPLADAAPWLHTVDSPLGRIEAPKPLFGRWDRPPSPLGSSSPSWLAAPGDRGADLN